MHLVDWRLAAATGARLVPPGPKIELSDAVEVVADLRRAADRADEHVAAVTGLEVAAGSAITVVVDRPEWIRANVEGFRLLADPIIDEVLAKRGAKLPGPLTVAVGARAAGVEVGLLLSYLATRVLGQFELLGPPRADGGTGGRLTLVAPNIVAAERMLRVDPADFRLWVCLHEVTHRTQFATAPWLHDHVQHLLRDYLVAADLDAAALWERLRDAVRSITGSGTDGGPGRSLMELVQTPEQRAIFDRVTGLMSLLEGHADVVMDQVGPGVVPSVATIRERFERRRRDAGPLQRVLRRLLGLEMKLRQYAEGAAFVRAVIDEVGMAGLNVVWTGPDQLPTAAEIRAPRQWLDRVGPPPAVSA